MGIACSVVLSAGAAVPAEPGKATPAPAAAPDRKPGFHGLVRLGAKVRGEYGIWEASLLARNEKGKTVPEKAVLEIPSELPILVDRKIVLEDLAAEETALILGREIERDVQSKVSKSGETRGGQDRQIQNARVILAGRDVEANEEYREGRDKSTRWFRTEVKSSGAGLWVKHKDSEYRVTLDRGAALLKRIRGERKLLRPGAMVLVKAEKKAAAKDDEKKDRASGDGGKAAAGDDGKKAAAPVEGKKAGAAEGKAPAKTVYVCTLLVVIDPQSGKVYEAILP